MTRAASVRRYRAGGPLAGALDRVAAAADRHTTPQRALGVLAGAVVVTATTLALVSVAPLPGQGWSTWATTDLDVFTSTLEPPPAHQPPRPAGVLPAVSPPAGPLTQPGGEFVGWAVVDLATGAVTGSDTFAEVSTTASMIKAWIAADYLRRATETGTSPSSFRLQQLELVIRDSHNGYAEAIFQELGARESIERLISICRLTDSRPYQSFWSNTQLSPRDTARLGACIADGRAAGPEWTEWLLAEMRAVRGSGDFGVRHAFPVEERSGIAIKNGWIDRSYDGNWHVNCLAIGDTWAMGVMARYPIHLGYEHGAELCRSLAVEHLLPTINPLPSI